MEKIANRLKEAMEIRGLKQADIVEKTGINKGALSSYLSGRYNPKQDNIYLLAMALDVNEAWLMGADVPMERSVPSDLNQNLLDLDDLDQKIIETYKALPIEKKEALLAFIQSITD